MVQIARLVPGVFFLALFAGFELRIPQIVNLIPGSYGGLPYTGYVGFGFLLTGITGIASAFSSPSMPRMPGFSGASGPGAQSIDPTVFAAAMAAAQQARTLPATVACPSCGRPNPVGGKFCAACAAPLPASPVPAGAALSPPST